MWVNIRMHIGAFEAGCESSIWYVAGGGPVNSPFSLGIFDNLDSNTTIFCWQKRFQKRLFLPHEPMKTAQKTANFTASSEPVRSLAKAAPARIWRSLLAININKPRKLVIFEY